MRMEQDGLKVRRRAGIHEPTKRECHMWGLRKSHERNLVRDHHAAQDVELNSGVNAQEQTCDKFSQVRQEAN